MDINGYLSSSSNNNYYLISYILVSLSSDEDSESPSENDYSILLISYLISSNNLANLVF